MNKKMIELEDVSFAYQKDWPIFEGLSLQIAQGETIGLVGANGAGKSTLLKVLVGLLFVDQGRVTISDYQMSPQNLRAIRQRIGFSFQDADSQLFMTTVFEDVAFGPRNQGLSEEAVKSSVHKALDQVDAVELMHRPPYKLSGGEKRRVALATVLSMAPQIIILDEPVIGLDPKSRRHFINLLKGIDQTKIIATHDMDMALELCDRVVVMNHGKIERVGDPISIFDDRDLLERSRLEQPLTMQKCLRCQSINKELKGE
jgi:cobalt/nickel transport system ATP-binding protein